MAFNKRYTLPAPRDPEVNIKGRDKMDYFITLPANFDQSKKYGLVFCIPGWGDSAKSEYQAAKLRPYIADKYDLIVVGVRYHNDLRYTEDYTIPEASICYFYGLSPDYFDDCKTIGNYTNKLFDLIVSRNICSLESQLGLRSNCYHQYCSFGFMPAIDHLNVLFEIMQNFNIDKRRIIAFGSSYGGYIACLMAKYAPHTFSLVIENSGFCLTLMDDVLSLEIGKSSGAIPRIINQRRYQVPIANETLWSSDETSEYYFSDAHKKIRNLLLEDHRTPSSTIYCCYHSVNDRLVPIRLKDKMCEVLSKFNVVHYERITEKDIDGQLFKTNDHSMNASLEKLFDRSMEKYEENNYSKEDETDFDKDVSYGFPCMDRIYNFTYSKNGMRVGIVPSGHY